MVQEMGPWLLICTLVIHRWEYSVAFVFLSETLEFVSETVNEQHEILSLDSNVVEYIKTFLNWCIPQNIWIQINTYPPPMKEMPINP